ncbi:rhodanese-like domain-containing protein [Salidesulfovibrio onnuriiensis]|uniref:rhodanese-like domain-containing protein n=1 Tax=Salidesulfovibrio onnuriiensis TaxID=2583823 RepID=UPI0011CA2A04|nr:rhodanese-like domain-containing protein [Salidesulfovibrio onnuriiensis]
MSRAIQNIDPKQAEELMSGMRPDEYTLLDVRQPWEYEVFHIPGALLAPLPELADHLDEFEQDEPVIVYCRSGGRSMAAAKILAGNGYTQVHNLMGGASAWLGQAAYGPVDLGLIDFTGSETPGEAVAKAFDMEHNLQLSYLRWAEEQDGEDATNLFVELAGFEELHKDVLYRMYAKVEDAPLDRATFEARVLGTAGGMTEGGVEIETFLEEHGELFEGLEGIVMLSMMIESQAYDYYMRCSRASLNSETREAFGLLAREEQAHLRLLGRRMDAFGDEA